MASQAVLLMPRISIMQIFSGLPRKKDNQAGFTLLEVMIALAVFAAAALVYYQQATQSSRVQMILRDQQLARLILQHHLSQPLVIPDGKAYVIDQKETITRYSRSGRNWQVHASKQFAQSSSPSKIELEVVLQDYPAKVLARYSIYRATR